MLVLAFLVYAVNCFEAVQDKVLGRASARNPATIADYMTNNDGQSAYSPRVDLHFSAQETTEYAGPLDVDKNADNVVARSHDDQESRQS